MAAGSLALAVGETPASGDLGIAGRLSEEVMMTKYLRLGLLLAGAMCAVGSVAACADDSTATAPITSAPVTTTSVYSSSPSASAAASPVAPAGSDSASQSAAPSAGSSLPATAPSAVTTTRSTAADGGFAAPQGQTLTDKDRKYLQALRDQKVTLLGDTDNSVALTLANYVCSAEKKNTDPVTVKGYVTALVSPGTNSTQEANAKADKVIKAAEQNYC
ncbi:DUF732 domain-containing protein [Gordonia desulfuricans]|nr:DUF732 domain-containing protein [Gordonia desulfuricans]